MTPPSWEITNAKQYGTRLAKDMVDIYYRRGWSNRMRLTPGSPAVRGAGLLAAGFASHAHMTATFRSRLGIPPQLLR